MKDKNGFDFDEDTKWQTILWFIWFDFVDLLWSPIYFLFGDGKKRYGLWQRIKCTVIIIWADLWLRNSSAHWTNDFIVYEYGISFFKNQLKHKLIGYDKNGGPITSCVYRDKMNAKKEIIYGVYIRNKSFKTFWLRQWAWVVYRFTGKLPNFVFRFNWPNSR